MGLPETGQASYVDVLNCISIGDKNRFEDLTLGCNIDLPVVRFPEIKLRNGNVIQDTHYRLFDADGGLVRLGGYTKLVRVA
jgi:hypothetical protein